MKQSFQLLACALSCLFASVACHASSHTLTLGPSIEYQLPPNEPQYFLNTFIWTITANCVLSSQEDVIHLSFTVLRKSGAINNQSVTTGDSVSMTFYPNDTVTLSASSGGKVELINNGNKTVTANCYTM